MAYYIRFMDERLCFLSVIDIKTVCEDRQVIQKTVRKQSRQQDSAVHFDVHSLYSGRLLAWTGMEVCRIWLLERVFHYDGDTAGGLLYSPPQYLSFTV